MHKIGHGGTHLTSWAQELHSVAFDAPVQSLSFSPDNSCLAAAIGSSICILTTTAEQKQILLDAHGGAAVRCVIWIDRNTLVSCGADKLRIWENGECTSTLEGHSGEILSVAATATPSLLVSASSDATLKLWRNAEVEKTCLGHEGPVYSVAFSRDGSNFISASADKTARIWSVDGMSLAILRHRDEVRAACFGTRRSASLVVTGSLDATVFIWQWDAGPATEPVTPTPLQVCKSHTGGITAVAIGENGQTLCTASMDKSLRLWTLHDGRFARALPGGGSLSALAFSTAGAAKIASATQKGTVKIFGIVPKGRESGMFT